MARRPYSSNGQGVWVNRLSLDEFCKKFSERISNRYLVYTKDYAKDMETIMILAYLVSFL